MSLEQIDAQSLKSAFITGAKSLEAKKEWINELNVFPVPDGDTGTNMTMTIMSAAKTLAAEEGDDIASMCKAIAQGSLRGARGNSGVILSQLVQHLPVIHGIRFDLIRLLLRFDLLRNHLLHINNVLHLFRYLTTRKSLKDCH